MTRYDTTTLLTDIVECCERIALLTDGLDAAGYRADWRARIGVERLFEIIGEALTRMERIDPETAEAFTHRRRIIGLRNRLAHGYDELNHPLVLEIAQEWMPLLEIEARRLLDGR